MKELIAKYNVPVPRYTSYPSVPCWDNNAFSVPQWMRAVEKVFDETNESKGISLYIHLPFCDSLCTYCACNTHITVNHAVEEDYLKAVITEWELYRYIFGSKPVIREIHIGGGTPTFFSPENLKRMILAITKNVIIHDQHEFSFEGHPNNTTQKHLNVLSELGFRRVSYGIQDMNETVQHAIHRIQPLCNVERVVKQSREAGFTSVCFDLIYGLPFQTVESITVTFQQVISLKPERIAFYSYAHVPWIKPGQRSYEDSNLPGDEEKRQLYETGRLLLLKAGYHDIGMDHFALDSDPLYKSLKTQTLHRNFMGYTTSQTDLLIGLGASAISDAKYAYAQNAKKVNDYEYHIGLHRLAVSKGHIMTEEDQLIRNSIVSILCNGKLSPELLTALTTPSLRTGLEEMEGEGILSLANNELTVTEKGRPFIRNICRIFDKRLDLISHTATFSNAV